MNTGPLKTYAVQARKNFIQAVTDRAAQLGITKASIAPVQASSGSDQGVVVIAGAPFPASVVPSRERVVRAIERDGFRAVIEHVAYTWFNRLVALRYMEVHGYLDHGLRVLSDPGGGAVPEAVARLRDLDLPTLDKPKAIELAMAGNQDEALYRLILLAQCQHLARPMPWLFDTRLHDGVDVLLPEHLLATDSLVRNLVDGIPEDDWKQGVEIIGWLYQFFISERKDEVIGSVVAPEDIPAATQLFTPNWIVQYLVQNSVGRLWMESYPNSSLRQHMPYYIDPAPQDPAVQAELDKIVVRERTPESLTVLDPACGSGHILVEAFRLLFRIYLERGHREREIPRLIFANNLFGLDIDDRAAQLACMTLLFEARRHDAKIFVNPPYIRILAIQQSRDEDRASIDGSPLTAKGEAKELAAVFHAAKTFGSLISIPESVNASLGKIRAAIANTSGQRDLYAERAIEIIKPLADQADIMTRTFDVVVANPPYMGGKGMTKALKEHAATKYPKSKYDTFSMFIERGFEFTAPNGFNAMVTMQSWMFLSSFEEMRKHILARHTVHCLAHFPYDGKSPTVMGISFGISAMSIRNSHHGNYIGHYCCSRYHELRDDGVPKQFPSQNERLKNTRQSDFTGIPGTALTYWMTPGEISAFARFPRAGDIATFKHGMSTSDNERFLRYWWEPSLESVFWHAKSRSEAVSSGKKWFPFNKGGAYRRWYGNIELVVNWKNDGMEIKDETNRKYPYLKGNLGFVIGGEEYYYKEGITWSSISSSLPSFRWIDAGSIICNKGQAMFPTDHARTKVILGILNSDAARYYLQSLSPTLGYEMGYVESVPVASVSDAEVNLLVTEAICISRQDWNSRETAFSFPSLTGWGMECAAGFNATVKEQVDRRNRMGQIEAGIAVITNAAYGYTQHKSNDADLISYLSVETEQSWVKSRISFAIGCMMGRYSLDEEGLVYAGSRNLGFDSGRYKKFKADADGIIPITDEPWFADDAADRFFEFVRVAWLCDGEDRNLRFIASALGAKQGDAPRVVIRDYLAHYFFREHCQTYKKRPIYWLFSSGKHQAFQCLVYAHRYNVETLSRMRADYVIPLQGKLQGRLTTLSEEVARAGSTAQRKQAQKAVDLIEKQIRELATFDDQLRSYADKRIELDLDDGVKVNIRKFGTLIDLKPLGNLDTEE